jgi:hypothetical protein
MSEKMAETLNFARINAEVVQIALSILAEDAGKDWAKNAYNAVKDVNFKTAKLDVIENSMLTANSSLGFSDDPYYKKAAGMIHLSMELCGQVRALSALIKAMNNPRNSTEQDAQGMINSHDGITSSLWPGIPQ